MPCMNFSDEGDTLKFRRDGFYSDNAGRFWWAAFTVEQPIKTHGKLLRVSICNMGEAAIAGLMGMIGLIRNTHGLRCLAGIFIAGGGAGLRQTLPLFPEDEGV